MDLRFFAAVFSSSFVGSAAAEIEIGRETRPTSNRLRVGRNEFARMRNPRLCMCSLPSGICFRVRSRSERVAARGDCMKCRSLRSRPLLGQPPSLLEFVEINHIPIRWHDELLHLGFVEVLLHSYHGTIAPNHVQFSAEQPTEFG